MMVERTYRIARRFDPAWSLLGRRLRRRAGDARQAEAYHVVVVAGLVLVLVLVPVIAPVVPFVAAAGAGFWAVQAGLWGLVVATCVAGVAPEVVVVCRADHLDVRQGRRTCRVDYDAVTAVETVTALRFHRHEARYAATRAFTGGTGPVLLLHSPDGPVALGEVRRTKFEGRREKAAVGELAAWIEEARRASAEGRAKGARAENV